MYSNVRSAIRAVLALAFFLSAWPSLAESKNLAPGFDSLPKGAKILVMPPDVELFSISGGGVVEPKADWTELAHKNVHAALSKKSSNLGLVTQEVPEKDADELAEVNTLHAAVARSIALHHITGGMFALPTKDGKLDWSLGDAVQPIKNRFDADYALFIWMRDSYASSERVVAMIALALLGVGVGGGVQTGYASLVELSTGKVVWFNRILRGEGDLREKEPADETVQTLLKDFPKSR